VLKELEASGSWHWHLAPLRTEVLRASGLRFRGGALCVFCSISFFVLRVHERQSTRNGDDFDDANVTTRTHQELTSRRVHVPPTFAPSLLSGLSVQEPFAAATAAATGDLVVLCLEMIVDRDFVFCLEVVSCHD